MSGYSNPYVQALRFGESCTNVVNQANVGARGAASLLAELDREMEELEKAIQVLLLENWGE